MVKIYFWIGISIALIFYSFAATYDPLKRKIKKFVGFDKNSAMLNLIICITSIAEFIILWPLKTVRILYKLLK